MKAAAAQGSIYTEIKSILDFGQISWFQNCDDIVGMTRQNVNTMGILMNNPKWVGGASFGLRAADFEKSLPAASFHQAASG